MSVKKMLEEKTLGILAGRSENRPADPSRRAAVTAPGALFGMTAEMAANRHEIERLQKELGAHEGALPVRKLDAKRVRASRWANRHPLAYDADQFAILKAEIKTAGGNVQPIKVRPVEGDQAADFEIVFGHRRHRACLELGLPVLAVVEALDDQALFAEMDRENRARADLTPYEMAVQYRRALDQKLFTSQTELAQGLGVTQAFVSQILAIASLPKPVIDAFPNPLEIQVRWGVALAQRQKAEPEKLKAAAERAGRAGKTRTAQGVLAILLDKKAATAKSPPRKTEIKLGNKRAAVVYGGERVRIEFEPGAIAPDRLPALERALRGFLQGKR